MQRRDELRPGMVARFVVKRPAEDKSTQNTKVRIGGHDPLVLRKPGEVVDIRESEVVETSILPTRQVEGERGKSVSKATATGVLPLLDTRDDDDEGKGRLKSRKNY